MFGLQCYKVPDKDPSDDDEAVCIDDVIKSMMNKLEIDVWMC